jgi:hypothetical protein
MASNITFKTTPNTFAPVFNPCIVTVKENDVPTLALTEYKYLIDVYVEGVSGYRRYEISPDDAQSMGTMDIGGFAESYSYTVFPLNTATEPFLLGANANGTQSILKVYVKVGYSYVNAGVYTQVPNLVTSSDFFLWNGVYNYNDWLGLDYDMYICNITNGTSGQFLTDMKTHYVGLNDLGRVYCLSDTPTDLDWLVIKTYNSSGGLIATNTKAIAVSQAVTSSKNYNVAACPKSINNMTGAWVSGGANPITTSVSYYTVQLQNSAGSAASEILTFHIQDEPCRYEKYRVLFLNRHGGFDFFNFNLLSRRKRKSNKKTYRMNKYNLKSTGIIQYHQDQSGVTHYVDIQETVVIRSEFLTDAQHEWLYQLIESPEIYVQFLDEKPAQNFKAIAQIVQSDWEEKTQKNDKLFSLELELVMSHKEYRQRR